MDKKYAIFDMDGTLVDSIGYWNDIAPDYLKANGVEYDRDKIIELVDPLTMTDTALLFKDMFFKDKSAHEIESGMNGIMEEHYKKDVPVKKGVPAYLEELKKRGVKMCVASNTAEYLMEICLKRLGLYDYFQFTISCETVGAGKTKPDIYLRACEKLGSVPAETAVYEDALYAAKTVKKAGFYLVGVYEKNQKAMWETLSSIADETMDLDCLR